MISMSRVPNSAYTAVKREGKSPQDHQPGRAGECASVARAIGAAAKLLGGIGETIEKEGADQQKIVQHRISGERDVARARALRGKEQEHGDQGNGADHDVAVDG